VGSGGTEQTDVDARPAFDHLRDLAASGVGSEWTRRQGIAAIAAHLGAEHVRLADDRGHQWSTNPGSRIWPAEERWGLSAVRTEQFLFVRAAERLRVDDRSTLGQLGVRSVLHLPLVEQGRRTGALDVAWCHRVEWWDDRDGPVVRNLARMLLAPTG